MPNDLLTFLVVKCVFFSEQIWTWQSQELRVLRLRSGHRGNENWTRDNVFNVHVSVTKQLSVAKYVHFSAVVDIANATKSDPPPSSLSASPPVTTLTPSHPHSSPDTTLPTHRHSHSRPRRSPTTLTPTLVASLQANQEAEEKANEISVSAEE
ncbi:hypothetical protein PIB30_095090, partial [Stylosanthes scabra]|nr:hypothetical protein [Stylosanthes scabra]